MSARIPLVDISRSHAVLVSELMEPIERVVRSGQFNGGPEVGAFETEFARYLGSPEAVAVSTGTSALHLTLRALDLGPEDEVVLPANSFVATAEAVVLAGAHPVFCDVDLETGLMTRAAVEAVLTPRTRALVPVHLFGNVVDMAPLLDLAETKKLWVVEDAAQAHGARYRQGGGRAKRAGAIGHAGCFSFYPTKNLGAIGEGGAVATRDRSIAGTLRALRDHGQHEKHVHAIVGDNARLAAVQAAALRVKLRHLDRWNNQRRALAVAYVEGLRDLPVTVVPTPTWSESVHHLFVVRTPHRESVSAELTKLGIGNAVHYPTPIHLQPAFRAFGRGEGSLPACERLAREILSLPMFPELTPVELSETISALGRATAVATTEPQRLAVR